MPVESLELYFAKRCLQVANEVAPPIDDFERVRSYRNDPVGFARDILGVWVYGKQREVLEALLTHRKVSVASGHKLGKSLMWAIIALWFYCNFDGGRVVIMAATDRQVNGIIWREIRRLVRKARVPIPGAKNIHEKAMAGLVNPADDSEIKGYTAKTPEAAAGTSGHAVMYLFDEASGIDDGIFSVMEGNRAGGNAWMCLISNPTKASGEFYASHHSQRWDPVTNPYGYYAVHISCLDSPNCTGEWREMMELRDGEWVKRTTPVPGLAMPEYVEEMKRKYGEDSWDYQVRVLGSFAAAEDAKIFPRGLIEDANERWGDDEYWRQHPPKGRLYIGVDPAGYGEGGDQSGFCARIDKRIVEIYGQAKLTPEAHIVHINNLILEHMPASNGELPVVCIESNGDAGWKAYCAIRDYADKHRTFEVHRVNTSDAAIREPQTYARRRDELWACGAYFLRNGGALPPDIRLTADLNSAEWNPNIAGKLEATKKKDIRLLLGRSPDLGDAFLLCCWEPSSLQTRELPRPVRPDNVFERYQSGVMDMNPYAAMDSYR